MLPIKPTWSKQALLRLLRNRALFGLIYISPTVTLQGVLANLASLSLKSRNQHEVPPIVYYSKCVHQLECL